MCTAEHYLRVRCRLRTNVLLSQRAAIPLTLHILAAATAGRRGQHVHYCLLHFAPFDANAESAIVFVFFPSGRGPTGPWTPQDLANAVNVAARHASGAARPNLTHHRRRAARRTAVQAAIRFPLLAVVADCSLLVSLTLAASNLGAMG
jgi:hypothetical protein